MNNKGRGSFSSGGPDLLPHVQRAPLARAVRPAADGHQLRLRQDGHQAVAQQDARRRKRQARSDDRRQQKEGKAIHFTAMMLLHHTRFISLHEEVKRSFCCACTPELELIPLNCTIMNYGIRIQLADGFGIVFNMKRERFVCSEDK